MIRGLLVDVDGTLIVGDRAVPGAVEALAELDRRGLPYRLVTNTTRSPRRGVVQRLERAGLPTTPDRVLNPAALARRRILDSGATRATFLLPPAALEDFEGIEVVDEAPDWLVVGDLGEAFDWHVVDRGLGLLLGGARFLALQKNRYWHDGQRLRPDAGPFVAALEYAAGVDAEVVGKPSADFFRLALASMGVAPEAALMVGDDVAADCAGARAAGLQSALVRTGKFREADLEHEPPPDHVLASVAEVATLLA